MTGLPQLRAWLDQIGATHVVVDVGAGGRTLDLDRAMAKVARLETADIQISSFDLTADVYGYGHPDRYPLRRIARLKSPSHNRAPIRWEKIT